tara:strand:+ start:20603 stop:20749 length:147 start_codon:yes stop_codon:yes gene_type:complete
MELNVPLYIAVSVYLTIKMIAFMIIIYKEEEDIVELKQKYEDENEEEK